MSPIGPESFQRLEEFPSFTSCIKCFGRPIIPPLLTPSRRHELKQLRIAATNKETELLRQKKEILNIQAQDNYLTSSKFHKDVYKSFFQSSEQESRALWYPSSKDCQEGISVAISKFPTSGIYSSVHTGAIVCSNVIEGSHNTYTSGIVSDSLFGTEVSVLGCDECSHNSINLECSLCQAECNQSFHNRSFASELSPEVPCRTFSLLQQNVNILDEELNSTVEETECESLPTVISNQKYMIPDTDSESNVTCMTQSTDLEKYMSFSYEFSSPDNSAIVWDSKSTSQQYTLSRSDDASSETIVNTENELTPCASTMAELTDNIEDELSTAEENAGTLDSKDTTTGTLKRAHSIDSYMKIIQTCARSMNVKKSMSEPFNTNKEGSSNVNNEVKTLTTSKTGLLIKEDSKESEEAKEIPERDISNLETNDGISSKDDTATESKSSDTDSFQKKHIRQNSYTLDHPSSVLILAHADCTCNFDAKCISPHCSALKDEITSFSAFTKEKVEVDIPVSPHRMKKLPICSESLSLNATSTEQLTPTVVDVFPVVEEDNCEKSNSGNTNISKEELESENKLIVEKKKDTEENVELLREKLSDNLNISDGDKNQEFLKCILEELKEKNKIRAEQLYEEQKQQWLKLQEEFEEQEKLLYQKLNLTFISLTDSSSKAEEKFKINCEEDCDNKKASESKLSSEKKEASVLNSSVAETPTPDVSQKKSPNLLVPQETPLPCCPSVDLNLPQNTRASFSPSIENKSPNTNPSRPLENVKDMHMNKDSEVSHDCNVFKSNELCACSNVSESLPSMNGFSSSMIPSFLLQSNNLPSSSNTIQDSSYKKCDSLSICICDKSQKQCECCTSFNGYCGYNIDTSYPEHLPASEDQNFVSVIKDLSTEADLVCHPKNSSTTLGLQNNDLNHDFTNCHTTSNSKKRHVLKKGSDFTCMAQEATLSSFDNLQLPHAVCNKVGKNILHHSSKEKIKLPVDNIVSSVYAKTLKNGSISAQDLSINKRITDDPVLMKKFEKLPAFVKGYLTRRLFKTERVQSLIKTLQDTALLIGKLSEDLSMKGDSVSERDVDFHRQLIVQLMTTFHNVYDIFCTISTKERMNIISESRNFRLQQKVLDPKPESVISVTTNAPEPVHSKKHKLSSATLKALERKRRTAIDNRTYTLEDLKNVRSRSVIDSRTYTIEDLKGFRGRTHSSMSAKNISVSPSTIYKTSVGLALKRKTASIKSSRSRQNLHYKWVP